MGKAESKNSGFIFLHRSIREHWIYNDAVKLKWWIEILMECNHADQKVSIGYDLIDCGRGQSLNSLLTWSKIFRVDISTVRRFLTLLEKDAMISTENLKKTTRLTVCNYDSYNTIPTGKAIQTQFRRNSDAIQTKNELKNDKEYTPAQQQEFEKFQKWILDHASEVSKMKEKFTIDQFLQIKENIPSERVKDLLKEMHNWAPLLKKNRSAYLTLTKWSKREDRKPESKVLPMTQPSAPKLKTL